MIACGEWIPEKVAGFGFEDERNQHKRRRWFKNQGNVYYSFKKQSVTDKEEKAKAEIATIYHENE